MGVPLGSKSSMDPVMVLTSMQPIGGKRSSSGLSEASRNSRLTR